MAVGRMGNSITMTSTSDSVDFGGLHAQVVAMTFRGTGLTADNKLIVRDTATQNSGSVLADYGIEGTSDNADLWGGRTPQLVRGLSIDNNTLGGTWTLTVVIRGGV